MHRRRQRAPGSANTALDYAQSRKKCEIPEKNAMFRTVKASNFGDGDYSSAFDSGLNSTQGPRIHDDSLELSKDDGRARGLPSMESVRGDRDHAATNGATLDQVRPELMSSTAIE